MKCKHVDCENKALKNFWYCTYCIIWTLAHDIKKQEHIHCKKIKGGCECLCKKEKMI